MEFGDTSTVDATRRVAEVQARDNSMNLMWTLPFYLTYTDVLKSLGVITDSDSIRISLLNRDGNREKVVVRAVPGVLSLDDVKVRKLISSKLPGAPPAPLYLSRVSYNFWY